VLFLVIFFFLKSLYKQEVVLFTKNYKSLREYKNQNAEFLSEPIVKSFLNEPENALLLEQSVVQGSEEASLELDKRFSKHFFLYRLIKYISTLSYHYSNDFDKL